MQQEILMYNPGNQAQLYVGSGNNQAMENLLKEGWVKNPALVAMYHPEYKKHLMVQRGEEQRSFENRGYFSEPTFIYHPKDGTLMVSAEDAKKAMNNGWYASPAHFPGNSGNKLKLNREAA